jgi:hypothetical protein
MRANYVAQTQTGAAAASHLSVRRFPVCGGPRLTLIGCLELSYTTVVIII